MMEIFLVDGDVALANRRDWKAILGVHTALAWNRDHFCVSGSANIFVPSECGKDGCVVVCHGPSKAAYEALKGFSAVHRIHLVRVSGGSQATTAEEGRIYHRRRAVDGPRDDHFRDCFARFVQEIERTGSAVWELLEGAPAPDVLLAYYLLGFLGNEDAEAERKRLHSAALNECSVLRPDLSAELIIADRAALKKLLYSLG